MKRVSIFLQVSVSPVFLNNSTIYKTNTIFTDSSCSCFPYFDIYSRAGPLLRYNMGIQQISWGDKDEWIIDRCWVSLVEILCCCLLINILVNINNDQQKWIRYWDDKELKIIWMIKLKTWFDCHCAVVLLRYCLNICLNSEARCAYCADTNNKRLVI